MPRHTLGTAAALAAVAIAGAGVLTGCSAGGTAADNGSDEPITLEFWGKAPGYQEAVDLWNENHPDVQVSFEKADYTKMLTAVQAGNAPCLAQLGYQVIPSFLVDGALVDISEQAAGYDGDFTPVSWNYVNVADGIYGIPVDTAPMALIYRKDLFAQFGITTPPVTWEEYQEAAAQVHAQDPSVSLGYFSDDATFWAGLTQQAGAEWFTLNDDSWSVDLQDAASEKVGQYWQGMIDAGTIPVRKSYTPALYQEMNDGKILSEVFGIWDTALIEQNVAVGDGKWAVVPAPVWADAPESHPDMGGSATSILKGCENVDAAVEFAHWMSTDAEAVEQLIGVGGLWPASNEGLDSPALDTETPFFGEGSIYGPFKEIAKTMTFNTTWGPTMNETNTEFGNLMGQVTSDYPISDVLSEVQQSTVDAMEKKGLTVQ